MTPTSDDIAGLTEQEAATLLALHGPNRVETERPQFWRKLLAKFWAPVPWMLELTIAIQAGLGNAVEATVMASLLLVNAGLSFLQESHADAALALLKRQLSVQARVLRDGRWRALPADSLVPGDMVRLRMGDIAPADIQLLEGTLAADQSALTGESLPVELSTGSSAFAGSLVRRGEATGVVTATGASTRYGRTAELVRTARTASHMQETILSIVRVLVILDVILIAAMSAFALATHMPIADLAPFALILLVAAVPVALPATFTLATALGARELAAAGVLVTRLSAIEEAASMDVLACDKTGTITQNQLTLHTLLAYAPSDEKSLLRLSVLASDEASQDPIDMALFAAARERGITSSAERLQFVPFDPANKRTEAVIRDDSGELHIVKGAPRTVATLVRNPPAFQADLERLAAEGGRVLAVAAGAKDALSLIGLIALADPPRTDSADVIGRLRMLGVRVMMVTGDGLNTARKIAADVGIGARACRRDALDGSERQSLDQYDVFAGVFPKDKYAIVTALQKAGHITGMTGDGVNDAPALKQAEVGIAVANATDVAKAAASIVLTNPGLGDVVAAVMCSRQIHQRMLTYTLNKIVKTLEMSVFLTVGVMVTGTFVVTPLLMVLLLFANDFVTMSIATDHVVASQVPQRWHVAALMKSAGMLAAAVLLLSFGVLYAATRLLHLPLPQLQTLMFVMLVFTGQGVVYLVRERRHFWASLPSRWLLIASIADVALVSIMATFGLLVAPLPPQLIIELGLVVVLYLVAIDHVKAEFHLTG